MGEPMPPCRPIRLDRTTLRTDEAEREIRSRAEQGEIFVSAHAYDRLEEREEQGVLNSVDMMTILKTGTVCDQPERVEEGWKVIVEKRMPGSRDAGVVTVIVFPGDHLEIVTVEWMDWL
ncbi:hypothetical protein LHT11_01605 [Acetobacter indonesiensis]|uniref:hypothetical protein n=1 Tax=Acetobacter indonesiensis TaxID=104101 RepID=UPI001F1AEBF3|nr:hypothetical protein [Acetobacter indonesiensis]MCG0993896.1 hypothetical protein [Acetobacter indonesiensis]